MIKRAHSPACAVEVPFRDRVPFLEQVEAEGDGASDTHSVKPISVQTKGTILEKEPWGLSQSWNRWIPASLRVQLAPAQEQARRR